MKLLLDTHLLLWAAIGTLPKKANILVTDPDNSLYFSSVSIWEIIIKKNLDKSTFNIEPEVFYHGLLDNGYEELPITSLHALAVGDLPTIHKDPFDRLLLAQAKSEGMSLLTSDDILRKYPGPIVFIRHSYVVICQLPF